MTIHRLKTWPTEFAAVRDGRKKFELRDDDRGFEVGDTLSLLEWDPVSEEYGGEMDRVVTYILRGPAFGLPKGKVIMSLAAWKP